MFVSYACEETDGQHHRDRVRKLCLVLRSAGVDARWDGPAAERPRDWAQWRHKEARAADFVVVIASPAYRRFVEEGRAARDGTGVPIEATYLRQYVDENPGVWCKRVLRIVLAGDCAEDFPEFLSGQAVTRYPIEAITQDGCERLLRYLHKAPWDPAPPVGDLPSLPPRPSADDLFGALDQQAWQELEVILGGVPASRCPWCDQAYSWAFGPPGSAEAAAAPFPDLRLDLYELARALGEFHHRPGSVPKALAFAHALAGLAPGEDPVDRKLAADLTSWVRRVVARHELPPPPPPPEPVRATVVLTVRLDQDPQDADHFYAEVWLRARGWRRLEPTNEAAHPRRVTLDGARLLLEDCLRRLPALVRCDPRRTTHTLRRIEFAVPDSLLEFGFDQWRLRPGPQDLCLGKRYEVVLRCPDARDHGDVASLWSDRWRCLTRESHDHKHPLVWLDDEDLARAEDLMYEWCEDTHPVGVAISTTPAEPGWRAALEAGVPVILWQRDGPAGSPPPVVLRKVLPLSDVTDLPRLVKTARREADPAIRPAIALLWDDPDHALDTQALTDTHLTV
ncbi:toll/interleukin-1 receptor domain-containing protein [Streptomyces sp. NA02950]|uniref:toll/interleukin-1 receptor domain-containing protein n=1 Tax=Streptomyces sp. NA02950 TaxID=2742137 RepID=UPI001590B085|nr:toll/interleukin-1 receptor domain-containing protein [Streptomyces sp. NA02950]QKV95283.1 toll/interleukin-1 receptor domain-containing protein [Streptomyces sp. NA02950]